jgi:hypothetical protein
LLLSSQYSNIAKTVSILDNGKVRVYARNGVIVVDVYAYNGSVGQAPISVGTIPSGYRPSTDISTAAMCAGSLNQLGILTVSASGDIKVSTNVATSYFRGSITYVI